MKNLYRYIAALLIAVLLVPTITFAGNKDRAGEAGAAELLINPWAGSSGWGGANLPVVNGLEAMFNNVAGIAFVQKSEFGISHSNWLKGSGVGLLDFGFAVRVSETGVIGFNVMSMNIGEIDITTVDLPEGGIGTFNPNYLNIGLAYSKAFSNSIYGGLQLKIINEGIANASTTGIAIDAGIQYIAGDMENIHFGISLRNWGPKMKYGGDGYSLQTFVLNNDNQFTVTQRGAAFELPAQLNIGAAYDFLFGETSRLTLAATFASNAFKKDQIIGGLEFSYRDILLLRGGYAYEEGIYEPITNPERSTAFRGPSGGFSLKIPMNKDIGSFISVDFSYRATTHFSGIKTIGGKISF